MPSPFPGMDPYVESRLVWRGFHARLIVRICDQLQPQLGSDFVARADERVILNPLPDYFWPDVHVRHQPVETGVAKSSTATLATPATVTVPEEVEVPELSLPHRFIEIRAANNREVVTVIEILSPWNKQGDGPFDYRSKQREILQSGTNLVEIDLLRAGRHAIAAPREALRPSDYRVCIHTAGSSRLGVISFGVREPLPTFVVPVSADRSEVLLNLSEAFTYCYDAGVYQSDAEYRDQPDPPLSAADWEWSRALLAERGLV